LYFPIRTERRKDVKTERQTDIKMNRQKDKQTNKQPKKLPFFNGRRQGLKIVRGLIVLPQQDRKTYRCKDQRTDRHKDVQTERQTNKQTDKLPFFNGRKTSFEMVCGLLVLPHQDRKT
jgi:hypothetical protein